MIGAHHSQQGPRAWLLTAVRWAAGLAVLAVLLHFLPIQPLRAAIAQVPWTRFLAVLAGYLLTHCLGLVKWRMVVNAAGADLDLDTSAQCYFGGLFGTLFLPSILGGDAVRVAVGLQRSPRPAAVLAGNVVDRFLDLTAQAGLVLVGIGLIPGSLAAHVEASTDKTLLAIFAVAAVLFAVTAVFYRPLLRGRSVGFRRRLGRLRHAQRSVAKRPRVLLYGWLAGTFIQTAFLALTVRIATYCGLVLPWRDWFFAWPLAKLAAMLPLTQGGIGIREAALVGLLAPFGAAKHLVLAAGLLWEGVVIAGGLIAGAVAFLLRTHSRATSI